MLTGLKVCVVPTNRPERAADFVRAWKNLGDWDELIIVEDGPHQSFDVGATEHHSWGTIEEYLGGNSWIISRRDSAIRCFGFLRALRRGAEVVLTLDDDVRPLNVSGPIISSHLKQMNSFRKWESSVPGMRVRGLPYFERGEVRSSMNVGLWQGVPDLGACERMTSLERKFYPPLGSRIIPAGVFVPVCGMNLCMTRDVLPLAYFPLMGEGYPFGRFDDIWFGVIAKKIMDHLGLCLSVGEPFVRHDQTSNALGCLEKEAPGIRLNESFWQAVDLVKLEGGNPTDCLEEIGETFRSNPVPYVCTLGKAIAEWCKLIRKFL